MATFPASLDTCALFGAYLCDTLLRLAVAGASVGKICEAPRLAPTGHTVPMARIVAIDESSIVAICARGMSGEQRCGSTAAGAA